MIKSGIDVLLPSREVAESRPVITEAIKARMKRFGMIVKDEEPRIRKRFKGGNNFRRGRRRRRRW